MITTETECIAAGEEFCASKALLSCIGIHAMSPTPAWGCQMAGVIVLSEGELK